MRIPLALSCLFTLASCSQIPLSTQSTTLIDALSADPDFTSLIRLLQRAKLIPTLNRLNGSTLFAPTNDALRSHKLFNAALSNNFMNDNLEHELRQLLFYHIGNSTLPLGPHEHPQVLKTLHYPLQGVQPPTDTPPPGPPWMPLPGGTLGGQTQRLRVASQSNEEINVGVDAFGDQGVKVVKGRVDTSNGVLMGIDQVLTVPPNLPSVISQRSDLSYLYRILAPFPSLIEFWNSTSALTLFLPTDDAWSRLHPLERLYLESEFAQDDLRNILEMHAVASTEFKEREHVVYSEEFDPGVNLTTLSETPLSIVRTPDNILVGSASLVEPDIYASNGVLHLVSSLLLPPGHSSLRLTPEKFLLALNCTSFISLIHSSNLTSLVDGSNTDKEITILAPNDDVLGLFGGEEELPEKGSEELRRMVAYHFLDGIWEPEKIKDGMLVETKLEEEGLGGGQQVMRVNAGDSIKFAGASIIGEKIQLTNNTLLYFISRPVQPPAAAFPTLLPNLDYSAFLAAISSVPPLSDVISTAESTTLLAPVNRAWKRLGGLVSTYLLSPEKTSQRDLERVLRHHVIQGVYYEDLLLDGGQNTFPTLEGSDVRLSRFRTQPLARKEASRARNDANVTFDLTPSGGWSGLTSKLVPLDILTRTGTVHEVSDILLPRSVEINTAKLVKAAGGTAMLALINKAEMGWVLTGDAPPDGEEWFLDSLNKKGDKEPKKDKWRGGWALLCPVDEAFSKYNLTGLEVDEARDLVRQHVIPTPYSLSALDVVAVDDEEIDNSVNSRPLRMDEDATYSTLLSPASAYGDVVFREIQRESGGRGFIIGIKDARGTAGEEDWAKVLSWGRTTPSVSGNTTTFVENSLALARQTRVGGVGGVIQISRVLVPYHPQWWVAWGAPVTVGALGILIICGFFWVVNVIWRRDVTEATYEPIGGFRRGSEGEDEED